MGSILGSGRSPGRGNGNPLQYSCLKNPMDRGAWWAMVHGLKSVGHNWARTQLVIQLNADTEIHFEGEVPLLSNTSIKSHSVGPTPCDPMNYTVHGILQTRILEWVDFSFSRGSNPQGRRNSSLESNPGEEILNPLQDSCLGHPMDRGAWWAIGHRVAKSWTQLKWPSMHACIFVINVIK